MNTSTKDIKDLESNIYDQLGPVNKVSENVPALAEKKLPKYKIPEVGLSSKTAYHVIEDELQLDHNPILNLASFCTTWMDETANKLIKKVTNKNFIDQTIYKHTSDIHDRVIHMQAHLFHADPDEEPVGTATIGSSEACMLGLLAHKKMWQRKKKQGIPNVIATAGVHDCFKKFCAYFDVEPRLVPFTETQYCLTLNEVRQRIDENTIAIVCVMGTTFTGAVDPVEEINDYLIAHNLDIPIHIDAAASGFIMPFTKPQFKWDFRLPMVKSINVSNHKFGLVYPGMGSIIFRSKETLPEELVFHIDYLGESQDSYTLNFSKSATQIVLQYYNFIKLGKSGYEQVMKEVMEVYKYLTTEINKLGIFESLNMDNVVPIVAVSSTKVDLFELSKNLQRFGWTVPAYKLPNNADRVVMRMVVKNNFSFIMADKFSY